MKPNGFSFLLIPTLLALAITLVCMSAPQAEEKPSAAVAKNDIDHKISKSDSAETYSYNRDVRPILAENCFSCHGPDSASRKGDLRLDKREAALAMSAIVPEKPGESSVVDRILSKDPEEMMPPPSSHKTLTEKQKSILQKWIAQGATYQPHWSFIAPVKAKLPTVKDQKWSRSELDHFVLAELEKAGLKPAPEADRRTLARRLSLDIRGLPPEPAEVESFVNDTSPDYYEKYVDRLLATPQWGEHRARYWLDYARYGDTNGMHFDNIRDMWSYRDWLIRAFNSNMPFDVFTRDNLAGDLLDNPTMDQKIASGFNRCNITSSEGGLIEEEYSVMYTRDRTETTSLVWMGITANCAVCHDHKFDPMPQKDFYALSAFFNNIVQQVKDDNAHDAAPTIRVPEFEHQEAWINLQNALRTKNEAISDRSRDRADDFQAWLKDHNPKSLLDAIPADDLHFAATLNTDKGNDVSYSLDGENKSVTPRVKGEYFQGNRKNIGRIQPRVFGVKLDQPVLIPDAGNFEADQPFAITFHMSGAHSYIGDVLAHSENAETGMGRGWKVTYDEGGYVGLQLTGDSPEKNFKVAVHRMVHYTRWHHVAISYDGSGKAAGVKIYVDNERVPVEILADNLVGSIRNDSPLTLGIARQTHGLHPEGVQLSDLKIFKRDLDGEDVELLGYGNLLHSLVAKPIDKLAKADISKLRQLWLVKNDPQYEQLIDELEKLSQEDFKLRQTGSVAHIMREKEKMTPKAFVLDRGEYDKHLDEVTAATPQALPPFPKEFPQNRLGLAKWLMLPDHPLVSRVTVNRCWQEVFGTGIVRSAQDFGISGELPSNQELLDWLAVDFRESGWNMKRLYKTFFMSATYRQDSVATEEKLRLDPANRMLSRGPRFRMDAEMVRDYALATSGLLNKKIGGESVKPYQPDGLWEAVSMPECNTLHYRQDHGDKLYRRSMYSFWKRASPPASLEIFNAPPREATALRRERTNTPMQALVTLNDTQFVEAARNLAERALIAEADAAKRLDFISQRLISRDFRPEEKDVINNSLAKLQSIYKSNAEEAKSILAVGESKASDKLDAAEFAAWTMLVNELMNLDEALNK